MTIKSMTGFGRSEGVSNGLGFTVEVRSVNHRYLDVKGRLPKYLSPLEPKLKGLVRPFAQRGRVDVQVVVTGNLTSSSGGHIDLEAAASFIEYHKRLNRELGAEYRCTTSDLMKAPGVFLAEQASESRELEVEDVEEVLQEALRKLLVMREKEGVHLEKAMEDLLHQGIAYRKELVALAEKQTALHRDKLKSRIQDAIGELDQTQNARLMIEVGILAERLDVQEELDRLSSHFEQFLAICGQDSTEAVGRRLDFLCQEIVREINTTASKAQSIEITQITIELKTLMERVREQVQNVE